MSALLWWLIPVGATLLALAWAALRSRPRRPLDTHSSLGDMARFRAAMRRPMPDGHSPRPPRPAPRRAPRASRPSASALRARRDHGPDGRPG
ncbi:MAG: hypothetical protein KGN38_03600 [Actinomycetales bacterium]|nr:hypothetical protein [Actinomycetales bacterium]